MTRRRKIVILDDEPERIREMLRWLSLRYPDADVVTFDNAPEMIDWMEENLEELGMICLDHDLGPNRRRDGQFFDPGIGRDVADYLATRKPVCPVLIHTTNNLAAPGMAMVLDDSGWRCSRVVPYAGLDWIGEVWIAELTEMLEANSIEPT
ncbi:MAG: hypothetical protein HUU20_11940 [Pirellulales bacterium]|nr:hypothetical protein [Pirellulales bacterium]